MTHSHHWANSSFSQGPDGTNGFAPGWTTRSSRFAGAAGGIEGSVGESTALVQEEGP